MTPVKSSGLSSTHPISQTWQVKDVNPCQTRGAHVEHLDSYDFILKTRQNTRHLQDPFFRVTWSLWSESIEIGSADFFQQSQNAL